MVPYYYEKRIKKIPNRSQRLTAFNNDISNKNYIDHFTLNIYK
jgi:hypothetical protein